MSQKRKGGGKRRAVAGHSDPHRSCVACHAQFEKEALLRVVRSPDGEVAMDVTGRINQRGAWVCPDFACLRLAVDKGRFARAFGAPIIGKAEFLYDQTTRVLLAEVLNVLGLARTSGRLIAGRTEVADAIALDKIHAVVLASDLAERSVRDMRQIAPEMLFLTGPSKEEIGHAIGRKPTGIIGLQGKTPLLLKAMSHLQRLTKLKSSKDPSL